MSESAGSIPALPYSVTDIGNCWLLSVNRKMEPINELGSLECQIGENSETEPCERTEAKNYKILYLHDAFKCKIVCDVELCQKE